MDQVCDPSCGSIGLTQYTSFLIMTILRVFQHVIADFCILHFSMLACARIGAVHSIVFAGFSSSALASRINDSQCKMLITANEVYRGTKPINLKEVCDQALENAPSVETMIVYRRTVEPTKMTVGRDKFWFDELQKVDKQFSAQRARHKRVLARLHMATL